MAAKQTPVTRQQTGFVCTHSMAAKQTPVTRQQTDIWLTQSSNKCPVNVRPDTPGVLL